jgi:hypothetical protein
VEVIATISGVNVSGSDRFPTWQMVDRIKFDVGHLENGREAPGQMGLARPRVPDDRDAPHPVIMLEGRLSQHGCAPAAVSLGMLRRGVGPVQALQPLRSGRSRHVNRDPDRLAELNERLSMVCRTLLELTVVVETLAEMIAASNIAAARDLLTSDDMDDVGTQMQVHLVSVRDALQQLNRPLH